MSGRDLDDVKLIRVSLMKGMDSETYHEMLDFGKTSISKDTNALVDFIDNPNQETYDKMRVSRFIECKEGPWKVFEPGWFDERRIETVINLMKINITKELVTAQGVGDVLTEDEYKWFENEVMAPAIARIKSGWKKERVEEVLNWILNKAKSIEIVTDFV